MTHALVDVLGEKRIPVMKEHAVGVISRDGFSALLHGPRRRRMRRDIDVKESASHMLNNDKYVEDAAGGGDSHTEITRDDPFGMIADKCRPTL
jgi:hypothetical protein